MNSQTKFWSEEFGNNYIRRNPMDLKSLNKSYLEKYGITRVNMNNLFLNKINRNSKILEIGSSWGGQLAALSKLGFRNLYGIDINDASLSVSKKISGINIIKGDAQDIPFKDRYFDLVFTSGLLIHISPKFIRPITSEIYRCSKKYIWGFEYYSESYQSVEYRGNKNILWKADFCKMYLENFKELALIKSQLFLYKDSADTDQMFLLKKKV